MAAELKALFDDLDQSRLRFKSPARFMFLCGGVIHPNASPKADSLRDYFFRIRSLPKKIASEVVLAEAATQIWRDTKYSDLISFEEDIARIADIVLVIAESPGSLAELGAFASNETIRPLLRVLMQQKYASANSFIRYGPIERIKSEHEDHVGFFPWKVNTAGRIVISSIRPHAAAVLRFIEEHISAAPKTVDPSESRDKRLFYIIYWILYLALAVSKARLYDLVRLLIPDATNDEIRNKLFCMELVRWISRESYSGKEYFYCRHDFDPFDYAFLEGVAERDSVRRKADVSRVLLAAEDPPKHVREVAVRGRSR